MEPDRCPWCGTDPLYVAYHDDEWGVPVHDDRLLFEYLILEGMQAGLSWFTVLKKRAHFRHAFDGFDIETIARYDEARSAALLADPGIIRNRLKVAATIGNARAAIVLQEQAGSLDSYFWSFVDGHPLQPARTSLKEVPARTDISDRLSKDLAKRGFRFVGSTIVYAFMQATGMVNDHLVTCHRHAALASPGAGT